MGSPIWLDAAQQSVWRAYHEGSARLHEALEADLRAIGLSLAEYEILVRLSEAPDRQIRMAELADSVYQSRSRLTHTISRLEDAGLVQRRACPEDRRGVLARLTAKGLERLEAAAVVHVAGVRELLIDAAAPEDLAAVGRAFRAVAAAARTRGRPSARPSA